MVCRQLKNEVFSYFFDCVYEGQRSLQVLLYPNSKSFKWQSTIKCMMNQGSRLNEMGKIYLKVVKRYLIWILSRKDFLEFQLRRSGNFFIRFWRQYALLFDFR